MSNLAWEAYDRLNASMTYLRDAMTYLPHRFGSLHRRHETMAKDVADMCTNFSQFNHMFDGEPGKAKESLKSIKKTQRARVKVKKIWP